MIVVGYLLVLSVVFCLGFIFGGVWATRGGRPGRIQQHERDLRSMRKQEAIKRAAAGRSGRGPR